MTAVEQDPTVRFSGRAAFTRIATRAMRIRG
jgi:hypothetical protein